MKKRKAKSTTNVVNERLVEFDHRLKELGRHAPVTPAIIAVNVVVWAFMVFSEAHWLDPNRFVLMQWGANYGPLTTHGQGWRLITACFIHVGIVQLLVNQWALWQYGCWLERFFGHLGFALLYILTGLGSNLVAIRWQPEAVLAGSTGPIAGLIGAVAAFCWRVPGAVPSLALNRLRAGTFVFLGYNVGYAMYQKRLDAAGFLSGLAFGFIGGLILSQSLAAERRPRRWTRNSLLAGMGLLLVLMGPYLLVPDPALEFEDVQAAELQALKAFQSAYDDLRSSRIDEKKFIQILGTDVLPQWQRTTLRVEALDRRHLAGDAGKIVELTLQSMKVREEGWNLFVDSLLANSDEGKQRAADKFAEAERLEDEADEIHNRAMAKHQDQAD